MQNKGIGASTSGIFSVCAEAIVPPVGGQGWLVSLTVPRRKRTTRVFTFPALAQ